MQKYKLFLFVPFLIFGSCNSSRQKFYETDLKVISLLEQIFEQEEEMLHAIKQTDETNARLALDSLVSIINTYDESILFESLYKKDSTYIQNAKDLFQCIEEQIRESYPEIIRVALLPDPAYTWKEEEELMHFVASIDSIALEKLKSFYEIRRITMEKYSIGTFEE